MSETNSTEVWRPVVGYEGLYEVSNLGRVRSLDVRVNCANNATRVKRGKVIYQHEDDDGRMSVHLCKLNRSKTVRVHRLVLEAFVGSCPDGLQCCHWDGNASNNRVENLRWGTQKENEKDKDRHKKRPLGEKDVHAKLKNWQAAEILNGIGKTTVVSLARKFGISGSTVCGIQTGQIWKHLPRPSDLEKRKKIYQNHKLNEQKAQEIRSLRGAMSVHEIASMYGISKWNVYHIWSCTTWKNAEEDSGTSTNPSTVREKADAKL